MCPRVPLLVAIIVAVQLCGVESIGEWAKLNKRIAIAAYNQECQAHRNDRPCPATGRPGAHLGADDLPPDMPCPCPAGETPGGGIPDAQGAPIENAPDKAFFVDEVIADGFEQPVGVSFTDNTREVYVAQRDGMVHYINLETGERKVFLDISNEVGMSGDRGLMDIATRPNFAANRQVFLVFVVDSDPNDGKEPHQDTAANQRAIRITDLGYGVADMGSRVDLLGGGPADGSTLQFNSTDLNFEGPPVCFDSHAIGAVLFGLDGSLIITVGEGSHWNWDLGDWGQDSAAPWQLDYTCREMFGKDLDIGSWRSHVLHSLSGKVLRISPDTGEGICPGTSIASQYKVYNPFCDDSNGEHRMSLELSHVGQSPASKVWAYGVRNPFRAAVRPPLKSETVDGPGVIYVADVGCDGYEEINAVTKGGQDFGWPCWEGPYPHVFFRDSPYNDNTGPTKSGCAGSGCKGLETILNAPNGNRLNCPYIYHNVETEPPFYYWSRWLENDPEGNHFDRTYTGQNLYGRSPGGIAFYNGDLYPAHYKGAIFVMDFTTMWILVLYHENDVFTRAMHFADLIYTQPSSGAKVTLTNDADGNICYLTMDAGELRCFRYLKDNIAPFVTISYDVNAGNAPLSVQFSMDGTWDRERDDITFKWEMGDGTTSFEPNPRHTFQVAGIAN